MDEIKIAGIKPDEIKLAGTKNAPEKEDQSDVVLNLLSPNRSIDLKVAEVLADLPKTYAVVLIMTRAQHELRYLRLIKHFTDKGIPGVYITLNKSTAELLQEMVPQGVKPEKIIFLDSVTKMSFGEELNSENIIYIESPDDITELNHEAESAINRLAKGNGFVIVDSITTLLVYNKQVVVEKFAHSLVQKIKNMGLQGVFLAAESTDKGTLDIITQFCDDTRNL